MNEHDEKNGIVPGNDPDQSPDNSDIEALYRGAVNREVPDFWSKIESGLDDPRYADGFSGFEPAENVTQAGSPDSSANRFAAYVRERETVNQGTIGNAPGGNGGNAGRTGSGDNTRNSGNTTGKKKRYAYWIGGLAAAAVVIIISVFAIANSGKRTKSEENNHSAIDSLNIVSENSKEEADISYEAEDADDVNGGKAAASQSQAQKSGDKRGTDSDINTLKPATENYAGDKESEGTAEAEQSEPPAPRDSTESLLPVSEDQDSKLYKDEIENLGITLRLQNVRSTGCVLMFTREEDTKNETGTIFSSPEYEIEKWNGKAWEVYPHVKEVTFDDEQWAVVKGKVNTYVADWWLDYGSLVAGKYRIIKMIYTDRDHKGYNEFRIAAEFEIN